MAAPFAHDEICVKAREQIDYSIKISQEMAASGKGYYSYLLSHVHLAGELTNQLNLMYLKLCYI